MQSDCGRRLPDIDSIIVPAVRNRAFRQIRRMDGRAYPDTSTDCRKGGGVNDWIYKSFIWQFLN